MIAFDAAMLALAAAAMQPPARSRWWVALAPWLAVAAAAAEASLPGPWRYGAVIAPLLLAAVALRGAAAPALLLLLPEYARLGDAALASGLWIAGVLLLAPIFERVDRAHMPRALQGAPLKLLCCGGLAMVLQPLALL